MAIPAYTKKDVSILRWKPSLLKIKNFTRFLRWMKSRKHDEGCSIFAINSRISCKQSSSHDELRCRLGYAAKVLEMTKPISEFTNAKSLQAIMANAKRLGANDVWREAFRRLCALAGLDEADPLHRDFYETLAAYEQLLTEKNNRTTRATRTRQKLANKGIVQCLEDWAVSSTPTDGFELLVANGLAELTGEYLVLKYHDRFSHRAVAAARLRLADQIDRAPA
jgi:hypothetical protein